ncbi:MAG: cytochrome c3 family protein [Duodenibacillus sp.]|nr:cytochrome c3 family protein [Duodenibacillus sp.]
MHARLLALALACALGCQAQAAPLADRHVAKGLPCAMCHGQAAPKAGDEVDASKCLACHPRQSIAGKFEKMGPENPHQNHLGSIGCDVCHSGHGKSRLYCVECHNKMKPDMR